MKRLSLHITERGALRAAEQAKCKYPHHRAFYARTYLGLLWGAYLIFDESCQWAVLRHARNTGCITSTMRRLMPGLHFCDDLDGEPLWIGSIRWWDCSCNNTRNK